jgi:hypothetical protein
MYFNTSVLQILRFVYGREKHFKDTSLAVQVFRFAHEMQIELLVQEAEEFIIDSLDAVCVFAAFDLFKFLENEAGLQKCKEMVMERKNTLLNLNMLNAILLN